MNNMPPVTKNLLIINILMFFGSFVAQTYGVDLTKLLGLHFIMSDSFNLAQIFTYMFMHGSFGHLFFNMFAFWMFGRILENFWGSKNFLLFFIICGIGAGITQEIIQYFSVSSVLSDVQSQLGDVGVAQYKNIIYNNTAVTVGASGAVYGILLAFGMTFPNEKLFIIPFPFPIKAKYFVIGYAVLELVLGLKNSASDNVAHFAHLGGMLFGLILILYWRSKHNGRSHF